MVAHNRVIVELAAIPENVGVARLMAAMVAAQGEFSVAEVDEVKLAVSEDGVDLMGFLTWGPIDILSSQGEMRKRYGFIYVNRTDTDLKDLARYKKKSFYWFKQVIASNGEIL